MVLLPKACIPTILPALVTPVSGGACLYSPFPSKDPLLRCILHDQIYSQRDLSAVSVTCWFYNVGPWFSAFLSHTAQRAHVVPPLPWFSFGKALICFDQSVSPKHSQLNPKVVQLYFPLEVRMVILWCGHLPASFKQDLSTLARLTLNSWPSCLSLLCSATSSLGDFKRQNETCGILSSRHYTTTTVITYRRALTRCNP